MMDDSGDKKQAGIPLVELHLHLEGCLEPELLERICAGHRGSSLAGVAELYRFHDFLGFLDAYKRVTGFLTEPRDFYLLARSTARSLAAQGVVYAEIIFTPLIHIRRGLDHAETVDSIFRGLREVEAGGGPRVNLIYDTVRQWGAEAACRSAGLALADRAAGLPVVGFGVGGDELSLPAAELAEAFRMATAGGLMSYVHAGEVGGPESVWEALEVLGARRIGHGIAALRDPLLLDTLAARGVALDCCPTSNVRTGVVRTFAGHPLPLLLERGVAVTLGSDDPGFFGAWLVDEIAHCRACWGWDDKTIGTLMRTAARHSFLPQAERESLLARLASPDLVE
jgi:adenosine deaminase